jgi:hypothetical protein
MLTSLMAVAAPAEKGSLIVQTLLGKLNGKNPTYSSRNLLLSRD